MAKYKYRVVWLWYSKYEFTGMASHKVLELRLNELVEDGGRIVSVNTVRENGGLKGWEIIIEQPREEV